VKIVLGCVEEGSCLLAGRLQHNYCALVELSGLLTMGNRPLFKQRKRQFMRMWAPKVSGHGGVAHATYKAEGPNVRGVCPRRDIVVTVPLMKL
jgi:hypothetical protein